MGIAILGRFGGAALLEVETASYGCKAHYRCGVHDTALAAEEGPGYRNSMGGAFLEGGKHQIRWGRPGPFESLQR